MKNKKNKKSEKYSKPLSIAALVWLIVFFLILFAYTFSVPESYIGPDALSDIRLAVFLQIIYGITVILPVALPIVAGIHAFIKNKDSAIEVFRSLSWLVKSGFVFLAAFTVFFFIMIFNTCFSIFTKDYSESNIISKAVFLTELCFDSENDTTTESFSQADVKYYTAPRLSGGRARSRHNRPPGKCYFLECTDTSGNVRSFILSSYDSNKLEKLFSEYEDFTVKIEYYDHSEIIKNISVDGVKHEAYITTQVEADRVFDKVEITMDEELEFYRPENMKKYGDIAWVVERDGELVKGTQDRGAPYSITAEYYTHTNLGQFIDAPGGYRVYLVKVIRLPDASGLYTIYRAFSISNYIEFEID